MNGSKKISRVTSLTMITVQDKSLLCNNSWITFDLEFNYSEEFLDAHKCKIRCKFLKGLLITNLIEKRVF